MLVQKNMEVAVMKYGSPVEMIPEEQLQVVITDIEREQEDAKKSNQDAIAQQENA